VRNPVPVDEAEDAHRITKFVTVPSAD